MALARSNAHFYNYGEPLVNPQTPRFIRLAKTYLMRTIISTSLSLARFDAEAYVESGLDSIAVSIDGATQYMYEKFRRNGIVSLVHGNLRKLVEARRRLGKRAPIITWRYLASEHNAHEISAAIRQARDFGVDQFTVCTPLM
jgi:MoaA/NifB/PqqE/SkfB family radical SAM enzyme